MGFVFTIGSTALLFASAISWLAAARVKIPGPTEDTYAEGGPFSDALAKSARLNARGAVLAAAGIALQAIDQLSHQFGWF